MKTCSKSLLSMISRPCMLKPGIFLTRACVMAFSVDLSSLSLSQHKCPTRFCFLNQIAGSELRKDLLVDRMFKPLLNYLTSGTHIPGIAPKIKVFVANWDPQFPGLNEYLVDTCLQSGRFDLTGLLMRKIEHRLPDLSAIQGRFRELFQSADGSVPRQFFLWLPQDIQWELLQRRPAKARVEALKTLLVFSGGEIDHDSIDILLDNLRPSVESQEYFDVLLEFFNLLPIDVSAERRHIEMLRKGFLDIGDHFDVEPNIEETYDTDEDDEWQRQLQDLTSNW